MGKKDRTSRLSILTADEAERKLNEYFDRTSRISICGIASTDGESFPYIQVEESFLKLDKDGELSWKARMEAIGLHVFLTITVQNETITVPICLVNPEIRRYAWLIAETSKIEKYGQKDAEVWLKTASRGPYPIHFDASPLCGILVSTELMYTPSLTAFAFKRCPCCCHLKEAQEGTAK